MDWVAGTVSCSALQVATVTVPPNDSQEELYRSIANRDAQVIPDLTEFQQRHLLSGNLLRRSCLEISDG